VWPTKQHVSYDAASLREQRITEMEYFIAHAEPVSVPVLTCATVSTVFFLLHRETP
jgi:hypothetical protein